MSMKRKVILVLIVTVLVTVAGWGMLAAAVYASGGFVVVEVDDLKQGRHLTVPVPSVLVTAALVSADHLVPSDKDWIQIQAQVGGWGSYIEGVLKALDDAPNAVLVEVIDGEDHVIVRKHGRHLKVDVDGSDISVHVSVPTKLVRRAVRTVTI